MSKFNFKPCFSAEIDPTKIDLPHGLSLMTYITRDEFGYDSNEELLGDDWSFVRLPCNGFRNDRRTQEVFQLLGVNSDGSPNLESLLDDHTDVVIEATNEEPFANYMRLFGNFESNEQQIEWLREGLHSDSAIKAVLLALWHTGIATDPKVVCLDVYSHSGEMWSFTGQGLQCEWDTAPCAGVFLPSESMRELLDELNETDPRDMSVLARENAKDYLKGFNLLTQGEVYQIVGELVETATGFEIDNNVFPECVGGYLGIDHAREWLEDQTTTMRETAFEVAETRKAVWDAKLLPIVVEVLAKFGIAGHHYENIAVEVLARHLNPPANFEWNQVNL